MAITRLGGLSAYPERKLPIQGDRRDHHVLIAHCGF